eukprot:3062515-Rhodomonas_salina.1
MCTDARALAYCGGGTSVEKMRASQPRHKDAFRAASELRRATAALRSTGSESEPTHVTQPGSRGIGGAGRLWGLKSNASAGRGSGGRCAGLGKEARV